MAQPANQLKEAILPESELNPLVNPLLAAHMGRWAEVYFTSPPEKRAQAVSDLVRELASQPTPEAGLYQRASNNDAWRRTNVEKDSTPTLSPAIEQHNVNLEATAQESTNCEPAISENNGDEVIRNRDGSFEAEWQVSATCESCGYVNAPQQRFCVMCGTSLLLPDGSPAPHFEKSQEITTAAWDEPSAQSGRNYADETPLAAELFQGNQPAGEYQAESPSPTENWSKESPAEQSPQFSMLSDYQSEPASKGYRIYIGLAVAILLGLLVYMTWRSNAAFWSNGTPSLPSVPAPESQPVATEPAAPTTSPSQTAPKTATASIPAASNPHPEKTAANIHQPEEGRPTARRIDGRARVRAATHDATPVGAKQGEQNGSEELATAERYLNSGPGTARDSRQAATWLWKSVAKQNATASVMLSDLYLRGDGVSKSCDQARLLLDAAARKGATAAAERLRNLQAFGCK